MRANNEYAVILALFIRHSEYFYMTEEVNLMHVLFICTGNTCRSPMAEGYFRHLVSERKCKDVSVSSAGIFAGNGEPVTLNSSKALKQIGIDISKHRSRTLTKDMLKDADLIIAMTLSHKNHVGEMSAEALKKTKLLGEYNHVNEDITDPFGGSSEVYFYCLNTMKPLLEKLLNEVRLNQ